MKKELTIEQRFPTKRARDAADEAIDALDIHEPMYVYIDTWIRVYQESGGLESRW